MADDQQQTVQTVQPDNVLQKSESFFVISLNKDDRWEWVLWSANGRALAESSNDYARRNDAQSAIEIIREVAPVAEILIKK